MLLFLFLFLVFLFNIFITHCIIIYNKKERINFFFLQKDYFVFKLFFFYISKLIKYKKIVIKWHKLSTKKKNSKLK